MMDKPRCCDVCGNRLDPDHPGPDICKKCNGTIDDLLKVRSELKEAAKVYVGCPLCHHGFPAGKGVMKDGRFVCPKCGGVEET